MSGAEQNEGMKKTLLFVLALIAVGCAELIPRKILNIWVIIN
jgi:hypothetical protein